MKVIGYFVHKNTKSAENSNINNGKPSSTEEKLFTNVCTGKRWSNLLKIREKWAYTVQRIDIKGLCWKTDESFHFIMCSLWVKIKLTEVTEIKGWLSQKLLWNLKILMDCLSYFGLVQNIILFTSWILNLASWKQKADGGVLTPTPKMILNSFLRFNNQLVSFQSSSFCLPH